MAIRGVKIPESMLPLLKKLEQQREMKLSNVDSTTQRRLYEMERNGIISLDTIRIYQVRLLDDRPLKYNKKHQRIIAPLVIGMLMMSESWLAYMWSIITVL